MYKAVPHLIYGLISPDFEQSRLKRIDYTYLQGQLEVKAGHNIFYFIDDIPTKEGIYNVNIILIDEIIEAKFYFWKMKSSDFYGLCVDIKDIEFNIFALNKYQKKR